jgi:cytidylate kinase
VPQRPVIAIDGPAGSGKTTLALALAKRLGLTYYDTGALYRAVTLAALERGIPPDDAAAVTALARTLKITLAPPDVADGRPYTVRVDGRDVTWDIRTPQVDAHVSIVAAHPAVRHALLDMQRSAARRGGVVMAGRDIGTVVAPDATVKIYLGASPHVRAERRWQQLKAQGTPVALPAVEREIARRDGLDAAREAAPLRPAEDAVVLDTDDLTVEEMVERAIALVEAALARPPAGRARRSGTARE